MKILAFVIVATIFEAVGDAVMRIALQSSSALQGRIALFGLASVLLALYGLFLNLAPVEFATVTGVYLASLRSKLSTIFSFGTHRPQASCSEGLLLSPAQRLSTSGNRQRPTQEQRSLRYVSNLSWLRRL
jgi:hypothetical protein